VHAVVEHAGTDDRSSNVSRRLGSRNNGTKVRTWGVPTDESELAIGPKLSNWSARTVGSVWTCLETCQAGNQLQIWDCDSSSKNQVGGQKRQETIKPGTDKCVSRAVANNKHKTEKLKKT
jgi:hypothetical protein